MIWRCHGGRGDRGMAAAVRRIRVGSFGGVPAGAGVRAAGRRACAPRCLLVSSGSGSAAPSLFEARTARRPQPPRHRWLAYRHAGRRHPPSSRLARYESGATRWFGESGVSHRRRHRGGRTVSSLDDPADRVRLSGIRILTARPADGAGIVRRSRGPISSTHGRPCQRGRMGAGHRAARGVRRPSARARRAARAKRGPAPD